MVRRWQVKVHQHQERINEAFGLTQWEMEEEPDGEDRLDGQVEIFFLTARLAIFLWRPGRDGLL